MQDINFTALRLEGDYYLNDNIINKNKVLSYTGNKVKLTDIARVFNPPVFKRKYGRQGGDTVPYYQSSDVDMLEPVPNAWLCFDQVKDLNLAVKEDWIIMTGFGSIGDVRLVDKNIEGSAFANNVCRIVVLKEENIPSGFLYAFLASKYGRSQVNLNASGSVVKYIEAPGIGKTIIPVLDDKIIAEIDSIIKQSKCLKVSSFNVLKFLRDRINYEIGWTQNYNYDHEFAYNIINSSEIKDRLDSYYYVGYISDTKRYAEKGKSLGNLGFEVWSPNIFKAKFGGKGYEYHTGITIYTQNPKSHRFLSYKMHNVLDYVINKPTVLVQSAGQRYGLLGTPVYIDGTKEIAATSDLIRIQHSNKELLGFLHCFLHTEYGRRVLLQQSYGTSIPHINVKKINDILVPLDIDSIKEIGQEAVVALEKISLAQKMENQAISMIEKEIG